MYVCMHYDTMHTVTSKVCFLTKNVLSWFTAVVQNDVIVK